MEMSSMINHIEFIFVIKMSITPPKIVDGQIELFGRKGREKYRIRSVYFYSCNNVDECIHNISIEYEDFFNIYYLNIDNISYEDLVRQNYILYFKEHHKNNLLKNDIYQNCRLCKVPIIR